MPKTTYGIFKGPHYEELRKQDAEALAEEAKGEKQPPSTLSIKKPKPSK